MDVSGAPGSGAVPGAPGAGPALPWEDHRAVGDLLHAYAWHFDRAEAEAVAALFTEDAVIDYGPEVEPIHGRAAVAPRIALGLREVFAATSHHVSNVAVTADGASGAWLTAYVHAWHRCVGGAPDGWLWGQYRCRAARVDGTWRLAALTLHAAGTIDFHRATMHPIGRTAPA